jgi:hypothetical protein
VAKAIFVLLGSSVTDALTNPVGGSLRAETDILSTNHRFQFLESTPGVSVFLVVASRTGMTRRRFPQPHRGNPEHGRVRKDTPGFSVVW